MRDEVFAPIVGAWPARVLQDCLASQLVSDPQALDRPEALDPLVPVGVLRLASRNPVAFDELAEASCNHLVILSLRVGCGRALLQ
jgi:hypothetical protein